LSKKELKSYLENLSKEQLEEQILDLYSRFRPVKTFYDFAFRPNEEKLLKEARFKVGKEYFPINGRKAKKRPSVAQKFIRHFKKLELDPLLLADFMIFNIETAQAYCAENKMGKAAFYKSMHNSFSEAADFIRQKGLRTEFMPRMERIVEIIFEQNWPNADSFRIVLETLKER
jgi:hypothetical protein